MDGLKILALSTLTETVAPLKETKSPQHTPKGVFFWGRLDLIYGGLITWLGWNFIPKSEWLSWVLVLYGGLIVLSALGLISGHLIHISNITSHINIHRFSWRLSVLLSLVGLTLGISLGGLCLASGLYWLGVYGVLGWGVFISSGLLLSGVVQLLLLYPALKLRRLLSDEVKHFFKGGRAAKRWIQLFLLFQLIFILLGGYAGHMSELEPMTLEAKTTVTQYLRATLEGKKVHLSSDGLLTPIYQNSSGIDQNEGSLTRLRGVKIKEGALLVSLYAGGRRIARVMGRGHDMEAATKNAARSLSGHPKLKGRRLLGGRLVVDRFIGVKAIYFSTLPLIGDVILALSINPGVDGIQSSYRGRVKTLLPSDLIERQLFGVAPLVPGVPELRFGLDITSVIQRLGARGLRRIRTEQWAEVIELERPEQRALLTSPPPPSSTLRGNLSPQLLSPSLSPLPSSSPLQQLLKRRPLYLDAAHRSGQYLTRHLDTDGRFHYQYFP